MGKKNNKPVEASAAQTLFFVLAILVFVFALLFKFHDPEKQAISDLEELSVLKDDSWEMYKHIYKLNGQVGDGIQGFTENRVSELDFYQALEKLEESSRINVSSINSRKDDKETEEYLTPYLSSYLNFKITAEKLMDYINNGKVESLSEAKNSFDNIDLLLIKMREDRKLLLEKLGYTDDEIEDILEKEDIELSEL